MARFSLWFRGFCGVPFLVLGAPLLDKPFWFRWRLNVPRAEAKSFLDADSQDLPRFGWNQNRQLVDQWTRIEVSQLIADSLCAGTPLIPARMPWLRWSGSWTRRMQAQAWPAATERARKIDHPRVAPASPVSPQIGAAPHKCGIHAPKEVSLSTDSVAGTAAAARLGGGWLISPWMGMDGELAFVGLIWGLAVFAPGGSTWIPRACGQCIVISTAQCWPASRKFSPSGGCGRRLSCLFGCITALRFLKPGFWHGKPKMPWPRSQCLPAPEGSARKDVSDWLHIRLCSFKHVCRLLQERPKGPGGRGVVIQIGRASPSFGGDRDASNQRKLATFFSSNGESLNVSNFAPPPGKPGLNMD